MFNNDEGSNIGKHEKLPIYKKAQEISTLVRALLKGAETDDLEVLEEEEEEAMLSGTDGETETTSCPFSPFECHS